LRGIRPKKRPEIKGRDIRLGELKTRLKKERTTSASIRLKLGKKRYVITRATRKKEWKTTFPKGKKGGDALTGKT